MVVAVIITEVRVMVMMVVVMVAVMVVCSGRVIHFDLSALSSGGEGRGGGRGRGGWKKYLGDDN